MYLRTKICKYVYIYIYIYIYIYLYIYIYIYIYIFMYIYIYTYVYVYIYVGRLAFAAKLWRCQRQSRSQPACACGGPAGLAHLWPRLTESLVLPHRHAPDTQTHTNTDTHTPTPKNGYTHMFITKQNLDTGHIHTYMHTRAHTRKHAHIFAPATRSRKIWNGVERIHACIHAHTHARACTPQPWTQSACSIWTLY